MKKIRIRDELVYLSGAVILSLATAVLSAAGFGMSVIVSPAYLISLRVPFLTFGQAEYIVQGILFIIFCITMKQIRLLYLGSFLSGMIYGFLLDMWRLLVPYFNPDVYAPGTLPVHIRVIFFIIGFFINALGATLYFKNRFYPQVYEFFVKGISEKYHIDLSKFKLKFDLMFLILSVSISFIMYHKLVGIGIGTLIMACLNGPLIGVYSKWFDKHFEVKL